MKIVVLCPYDVKTGGTELLHQLVDAINRQFGSAHISYINVEKNDDPSKITDGFQNYEVNPLDFKLIRDEKETIVVIPEVFIRTYSSKFDKAQKICWWLSVDNFVATINLKHFLLTKGNNFKNCLIFIKNIISHNYTIFSKVHISELAEYHLYQSEYAKKFLIENGVVEKNTLRLSDYINQEFISKKDKVGTCQLRNEKKELVLYNPKKGIRFTKKIIEQFPNFEWRPIQNMTTSQVVDLLLESKVYIDFGHHPGKDRFPREAAILENCIITNKKGSASNYVDLPIKEKYKFDQNDASIKQIGETIEQCLTDYNQIIDDFSNYRNMILAEKNIFEKDVYSIFSKLLE